jgi:hypothetical protein
MVTAIGQARRITDMGKTIPITVHSQTPFVSEPVIGKITLRTKISDLDLLSLGPASKVVSRMTPAYEQGSLTIALPAGRGTHWYVLKARPSEPVGKPSAPSATHSRNRERTQPGQLRGCAQGPNPTLTLVANSSRASETVASFPGQPVLPKPQLITATNSPPVSLLGLPLP